MSSSSCDDKEGQNESIVNNVESSNTISSSAIVAENARPPSTKIDRYGFIEADNTLNARITVPDALRLRRNEKENERSKKWLRMLKKDGSSKLKERARKGIPDAVRGAAWQWIMQQYVEDYSSVKLKFPDPRSILLANESKLSSTTAELGLDSKTIDEVTT